MSSKTMSPSNSTCCTWNWTQRVATQLDSYPSHLTPPKAHCMLEVSQLRCSSTGIKRRAALGAQWRWQGPLPQHLVTSQGSAGHMTTASPGPKPAIYSPLLRGSINSEAYASKQTRKLMKTNGLSSPDTELTAEAKWENWAGWDGIMCKE
ncbi:hypothetical protein A6R68_23279 [Neotoma lepida]|uniref:Uncharacterized protein n=1 Tax=Neotoma lepida TaxID=56216 RepID=A0A1A6HYC5_NEOLE|nr:hypothetical protein A6R68_23279 [Neotoma lepida]